MKEIFIAWFGAIVLVFFALRGAIDLAASIDYAQETFPFLGKLVQTKKWHNLLLSATCLFYAATLYELLTQPPPPPIVNPDPAVRAITPIVQENSTLRQRLAVFTEPESPNSLRRQTVRLADDVYAFWMKNPMPPQGQGNTQDAQQSYWLRVQAIYDRTYKDHIVGIIRQYKDKGVPTGWLEQAAENHPFGSSPFNQLGSPVCFQDELCQFRELAYHVDAHDQRIDPNF